LAVPESVCMQSRGFRLLHESGESRIELKGHGMCVLDDDDNDDDSLHG
jgi:hypothetical protein